MLSKCWIYQSGVHKRVSCLNIWVKISKPSVGAGWDPQWSECRWKREKVRAWWPGAVHHGAVKRKNEKAEKQTEKKQPVVGEPRPRIWMEICLNPISFSNTTLEERTVAYNSQSLHWLSQNEHRAGVSHVPALWWIRRIPIRVPARLEASSMRIPNVAERTGKKWVGHKAGSWLLPLAEVILCLELAFQEAASHHRLSQTERLHRKPIRQRRWFPSMWRGRKWKTKKKGKERGEVWASWG